MFELPFSIAIEMCGASVAEAAGPINTGRNAAAPQRRVRGTFINIGLHFCHGLHEKTSTSSNVLLRLVKIRRFSHFGHRITIE